MFESNRNKAIVGFIVAAIALFTTLFFVNYERTIQMCEKKKCIKKDCKTVLDYRVESNGEIVYYERWDCVCLEYKYWTELCKKWTKKKKK